MQANELVLTAGTRRLSCELSIPDPGRHGEGPYPGVLLLHELMGLTNNVRDDARRLCEAGYLTLTPDLFSDGGQARYCMKQFFSMDGLLNKSTSDGNREAGDLLDQLAAHPRCNGRIGMIGQCLSGGFVLQMARRPDMAAPVVFHHALGVFGAGLPEADARAIRGPVLGHFAAFDPVACPRARRERLKDLLHERLEAHVYEGVGHGIRSVYRNRPQSDRAWDRTMSFFERHLRSPPAG
jgi:carboxymethylenebutenolidase